MRLALLERAIQQAGSSPYVEDLYDTLHDHAVAATEQLQSSLGYEILPFDGKHYIECPEPRKYLPLEAWLITLETIASVARISVDETIEVILEESSYYHEPTKSHIDWLGPLIKGRFNVTGLWGQMSPLIFNRSLIGTTIAVSGEVLAGATSMVLASEIRCRGGEVFWDSTGKQAVIAASNSGTTVQLDQWGTPERVIADGEALTLCGKLDGDIERLILLTAYMDAWRAVTGSPEPGSLESEKADKHEYKRGGMGTATAHPSPMDSYFQEWAEVESRVKGLKAPRRWL